MAQRHLDRLSSIDASFLHQEGPASHMHIGGVLIFQGPPPDFADFVNHIRSRLHLVPRYRQKLATPPFETGRQLWVDDPDFNIEYHVRHTALPAPGTEDQLFLLAARIASQQLDRTKPLWENWLVEGLEGDRWALISKTHHSLVDGVSGVDLATVLLDLEPTPPKQSPSELAPWQPHREPSSAELVAAGVRGMIGAATGMVTRAASAATSAAEEGSLCGCHRSSSWCWAGGSGSRSNSTVARSTPEMPSTSEWWVFEISANRPPSSPSTSQFSHSGLARSSGWDAIREVSRNSCSSVPGGGSAVCRT